jgi:hypothetical protein
MIKKLSCPTFHQRGQEFWLLLIVVSLRISLTIQSNKDGRFELTVRDSHSTSKWKTRDKKTWTIDWSFPWWRDTREIERINVENLKRKKDDEKLENERYRVGTHTQGAENGSESIIKSFASLLNYFYFLFVCVCGGATTTTIFNPFSCWWRISRSAALTTSVCGVSSWLLQKHTLSHTHTHKTQYWSNTKNRKKKELGKIRLIRQKTKISCLRW